MKKLCYSFVFAFCFLFVLNPEVVRAQKNQNLSAGSTSSIQIDKAVSSSILGNYSIGIAQGNAFVKPNPNINPSHELTLETWVYAADFLNSISGRYSIIDRGSYSGNNSQYALKIEENNGERRFVFHISDGGSYSVLSSGDLNYVETFKWYHVVCTFNGNGDYGVAKMYVNGQLIANDDHLYIHDLTNNDGFPMRVGRAGNIQSYDGLFDYQYFTGSVSDIRIWKVARSQSQISASYNSPLAPNDTVGLRGYWKGDNIGNTTAPDVRGFADNDMQLRGSTWMYGFGFNSAVSECYHFDKGYYDAGTVQQFEVFTVTPTITNTNSEGWLEGIMKVHVNQNSNYPAFNYYYFSIAPNTSMQIDFKSMVPSYVNQEGINYLESHISSFNSDKKINISVNILKVQEMGTDGNINLLVSRNGQLGYNPFGQAGFTIKMEDNNEMGNYSRQLPLSYAGGLWLGAKVNGKTKTSVADYGSEFSPGPIDGNSASDPNNPRFRVYKISNGDRAGMNKDYDEWPVDLGAPVTSQGIPKIYGDEMTWAIYNDADPAKHYKIPDAGVDSRLGAEIRQMVYNFNDGESKTFYIRYQITNKSESAWTDAIAGIWSDIDLGDQSDDVIGSDSARGMGYAYNSSSYDEMFNGTPPVLGYTILNSFENDLEAGAVNIQMATDYYPLRDPDSTYKVYNFLSGKTGTGQVYKNVNTGQVTTYLFHGKPEENSDLIDKFPADKRILVATKKFNLNPGETREFLVAINVVEYGSILNSIAHLREVSDMSEIYAKTHDNTEFKILAVKDIKGDQGKQVRVTWTKHSFDRFMGDNGNGDNGPDNFLASYSVWRKVDAKLGKTMGKVMSIKNELFEQVGTANAIQTPVYSLVVPTLRDSSIHGGLYYTEFKVLAHAAFSADWIETLPDSGYSVDNLSPDPPANIAGKISGENVVMSWNKCEASDYSFTIIYSSITPFENLSDELIAGTVRGNEFTFPYAVYKTGNYYRVVHQDFSGNKGNPSDNFQLVLTGIGDNQMPTEFALHQNYPNPFNPETKIKYDLPSTAFVSVEVYNVLGELVQVLVNEMKPAGRYEVPFNSNGLSSTVYFCRMTAGNKVFVKKMLIVK